MVKPCSITVIIPNLNHRKYLPFSIGSALFQTRKPDRILVLDDGSTDGSIALLKDYAASGTIELFINPRRLFVNGAINHALEMVQTEFVTFLAADDLLDQRLYETALNCLIKNPVAAFCATNIHWIDASGNPIPQPADPPLVKQPDYLPPEQTVDFLMRYGSFFNGTGCIFRTEKLKAVGGFDQRLGSQADSFVMQRLAAKWGACLIPESLASWRYYPESFSGETRRNFDVYSEILLEIKNKLANTETIFPRHYAERLTKRLTFEVARAALTSAPPRIPEAINLIPSRIGRITLNLVRCRFGNMVGIGLLLIILRPFDIPFAIRRRIGFLRSFF